jgi:hypothetical protein
LGIYLESILSQKIQKIRKDISWERCIFYIKRMLPERVILHRARIFIDYVYNIFVTKEQVVVATFAVEMVRESIRNNHIRG